MCITFNNGKEDSLMDGLQLDDILHSRTETGRSSRSKPVKRKWREIEAIKDRQRLQQELMSIDGLKEYSLEDIDL
jgi:hypothetical protein